jgi:hypothetical protein
MIMDKKASKYMAAIKTSPPPFFGLGTGYPKYDEKTLTIIG